MRTLPARTLSSSARLSLATFLGNVVGWSVSKYKNESGRPKIGSTKSLIELGDIFVLLQESSFEIGILGSGYYASM